MPRAAPAAAWRAAVVRGGARGGGGAARQAAPLVAHQGILQACKLPVFVAPALGQVAGFLEAARACARAPAQAAQAHHSWVGRGACGHAQAGFGGNLGGVLGGAPSMGSALVYVWVDRAEVEEVWLARPGKRVDVVWPHALPTRWAQVRGRMRCPQAAGPAGCRAGLPRLLRAVAAGLVAAGHLARSCCCVRAASLPCSCLCWAASELLSRAAVLVTPLTLEHWSRCSGRRTPCARSRSSRTSTKS